VILLHTNLGIPNGGLTGNEALFLYFQTVYLQVSPRFEKLPRKSLFAMNGNGNDRVKCFLKTPPAF
jgi:hypothetical protein